MAIYGYARVSTLRQKADGNSLEAQKNALKEKGVEDKHLFVDSFTGTKMARPEFDKLVPLLKEGDTLVVTKLDRFARTAAEGSILVKELVGRGVRVHILNMGVAENTAMGNLMVMVMLAFAEYERDMIVERTMVGKSIAREKGKRVDGRPKKFPAAQLDHAMGLLDDGYSFNEVVKLTGISRSTLLRERRERKAKQINIPQLEHSKEAAQKTKITQEQDGEKRATELADKLAIIPSNIPLEEWQETINELEALWAQYPANKKIAAALALGRSSAPRGRYELMNRIESVGRLEAILSCFRNDELIASYLAKGLYFLAEKQAVKKKKDWPATVERLEKLLGLYSKSEEVAKCLAYTLTFCPVSGPYNLETWESVVSRLSELVACFGKNQDIAWSYEEAQRKLKGAKKMSDFSR